MFWPTPLSKFLNTPLLSVIIFNFQFKIVKKRVCRGLSSKFGFRVDFSMIQRPATLNGKKLVIWHLLVGKILYDTPGLCDLRQ
jgi:hypothetical protein